MIVSVTKSTGIPSVPVRVAQLCLASLVMLAVLVAVSVATQRLSSVWLGRHVHVRAGQLHGGISLDIKNIGDSRRLSEMLAHLPLSESTYNLQLLRIECEN